jgi:hypothetical protein
MFSLNNMLSFTGNKCVYNEVEYIILKDFSWRGASGEMTHVCLAVPMGTPFPITPVIIPMPIPMNNK